MGVLAPPRRDFNLPDCIGREIPESLQWQEGVMTEKVIDLQLYRNAKNGYQKLLDNNPHTLLTFEDYFKVKAFLENVHQAKLRKKMKNQGKKIS